MKKMLKVAKWEFLTRIKSKLFLFSAILFPLLMIGFAVLPSLIMTKLDTEKKLVGIIDKTEMLAGKLEKELEEYELNSGEQKFQIMLLKPDEEAFAAALLDSADINGYIVIPSNVLDSNAVKYYSSNLGDFKATSQLRSSVNRIVSQERMIKENLDPAVIKKLNRNVNFITLEPGKTEAESDELMSYMTPFVFIMILFMTIFMSSQMLMRSVLQERSNKLVETLLSSVSALDLMSGKILGLGLLGFVQLVIYLIIGIFVSVYKGLNIVTSTDIIFFIVYFIFGYLLFSAIFAAIGSMFDNEQEAQQVSSVMSIITVIPIMLSSMIIANPNATIAVIMSYIPVMTPFLMILRIGVEMPSMVQIVTTLLVLVLSVIVTIFVAGKIFRTAILMYGKRHTFPEIIRWIKE